MNKNNRSQINYQQPLKFLIIFLIRSYQYLVSPLSGPCCRFYPSCSNYAIEAIRTFGCFHGFYLTLKRILCCHPFGKSGYDPVPEKKSHAN